MKKAQAALEFLTTYGWAMLAIAVIIGAFIYFGIFRNPLPGKCMFGPEIKCQEFQITGNSVSFRFVNLVGMSSDFDFNMTYQDLDMQGDCTDASSLQGIKNGKIGTVTCTFPDNTFMPETKVRVLVEGTYKKSNGEYFMPIAGEIFGEVQ